MEVKPIWFFDSWAVLDGLAFASLRTADSSQADATVFLSVPDLEPVPVGRISTALRAQRSGFQDGFRNQDGAEFEFENLDQIREVIRRGYLAGGLSQFPAPVEGPPPNPFRSETEALEPPPVMRDGGEYYEEEVRRLSSHALPQLNLSGLSDDKLRKPLLEQAFQQWRLLWPYLQAFAEATVFEYVKAKHGVLQQPNSRATLLKWLQILHALDLWSPRAAHQFEIAGWSHQQLFSPYLERWNSTSLEKAILFRIPCPLREGWNHCIQTLAHKLLLPLVDRSYYLENNQVPDFVPGLLGAMIAVLTPELAVSPSYREADRRRLVGRACEWLNGELPQAKLALDVETELSRFASNRLDLNPKRPGRRGFGRVLAGA